MGRLDNLRPLTLFLGGILGAAGVALAAAASHGGDARLLGTASTMCLVHAPALVALYAANRQLRTSTSAALAISIGTLLFAGDLVSRHFWGTGLFPMSAPTGGVTMMLGWVLVAFGAFFRQSGR